MMAHYLVKKIKGSFWWRDLVNPVDVYKSMTRVSVADGSTILFWSDPQNGQTLSLTYPELFSFTKVKLIMFKNAVTPTIPHN